MSAGMIKVAALASAVLVLLPAAPVAAGPGGGGGQGSGSGRSDSGAITATVTYTNSGPSGGCGWEMVTGGLQGSSGEVANFPYVKDGVTFNLWKKTCAGLEAQWYVIPETEPDDLLPQLLQQVKSRRLPDPEPTFLALDPANNWAYVTVPLDFRAGAGAWRTVSVTASIGPVWATVTASPTQLIFDPGDPNGPGPVECAGNAPVAGYDPAVPGECSYTYRNASSTSTYDGYHFVTSTWIDWAISWTSSTGAGGALDPFSTSSTALLAVAEVKGLVTCTGSRAEQGGC